VTSAETNRWRSRVDVIPVVVILRHAKVASVFGAIFVAVSDQRGFPVVVDVAVRYGDEICGVCELERLVK
jgi:hypothetical protein